MSGGGGGGGSGASAEANELYRMQAEIGREQWDLYKSHGLPAMQGVLQDAESFDTPQRRAQVAGEAGANVTQAFAQQREAMNREAMSQGINPASGRYQGQNRAMALGEASTRAGAMTAAHRGVDDQAYLRRLNAAQLSSGQGAQAVGAIGGAASGMAGIGAAQQQARSQSQAGMWGALGTAAGLAIMSSKSLKKNKRKVSADQTLEKVKKLPVEQWQYKDGVADGGKHIGPYAEDFNKAFGQPQQPGINVVDAVGVGLASVQALAKKVDQLEKKA